MKTIKYIIPLAAALLLAVACSKKEDPTPTPSTDPLDPELTVCECRAFGRLMRHAPAELLAVLCSLGH